MAEPGAVSWQFERRGHIVVPRSVDEEELMLAASDADADDYADEGEVWRVTTAPSDLHKVRAALEEAGIPVESSELAMVSTNVIEVDETDVAKRVLRLIDALDDLDDVAAQRWRDGVVRVLHELSEHMFKEDFGLFPAALATLDGADWDAMDSSWERAGAGAA
jgi:hypothetical protein